MSAYHDQFQRLVQAVEPHFPAGFWWFGKLSPDVREHARPILATQPGVARAYLVRELTNRLYLDFYLPGGARPTPAPYPGSPRPLAWQPFVDELSAANSGTGTRQAGWAVMAIDGGEVAIRRGELTLWAQPDEIVAAGSELPEAGDEVELRLPKELPAMSPGFYLALGDATYQPDDRQVVRLYWNLYSWGAAPFVELVTSRLNRAGTPFRLKLVNHPDRYLRCDAAVLYLLKEDIERASGILSEIYTATWRNLKRPVPALTRRIAPGVGLAEEPPDGDSFGMHRCRLLAEGIVQGWEQGVETDDEQLAAVIERLIESGIDIEYPCLNSGSVDEYDIVFEAPESKQHHSTTSAGPDDYLQVAVDAGNEICREAFWHEGWCNWLGVQPRSPTAPAHQGMIYASLGPELYGGTSGVALFLAALAKTTGDREFRRSALGAIRQALGRAEAIQPPVQLGYFTGKPGLALTGVRVGRLLEAEDVVESARGLLVDVAGDLAQPHENDLLGGLAGGILALLQLADLLGEPSWIDEATRLGQWLLTAAECGEEGCSWPSLIAPDAPNLTGYSHGTAGIGLALFELWQAAGEERFHEAGNQAFGYERRWFNTKAGNWPDFREVSWQDERPGGPFPYAAFWCHGAPGIALSRLRAWQLTGEEAYWSEAVTALETARRTVAAALDQGTANYSLCHGLAGNASILLHGSRVLGDGHAHYRAAAQAAARSGIKLYAPAGRDWPNGVHGGWTPDLMLGLAGTGWFYLDMAGVELPPLLTVTGEPQLRTMS